MHRLCRTFNTCIMEEHVWFLVELFISGRATETQVDELTYRIRFDRVKVATAELIRQILGAVEVRDILIEDEPIEEIIKRIYAGEALPEVVA